MTAPARQGGRRWRTLRDKVLLEEPHCAIRGPKCTRIATTVDHVTPVSRGGDEFDRNNCRGACAPCNYAGGARLTNGRAASRAYSCPRCRATERHYNDVCPRSWWD